MGRYRDGGRGGGSVGRGVGCCDAKARVVWGKGCRAKVIVDAVKSGAGMAKQGENYPA